MGSVATACHRHTRGNLTVAINGGTLATSTEQSRRRELGNTAMPPDPIGSIDLRDVPRRERCPILP